MAGFDKIKRKLERYNKVTDKFEVVFEDTKPHSVPYEKCYEDEEIISYNYHHFNKLLKKLKMKKPGYYQFSVDTLGSYIDTVCEYKLKMKPVASMVKSNLD